MTITQIKNLSYRPQDLVYDPLFVVSGPRDHYKAEVIAKMTMAKYQVCPVFSTMFSDLPSYPRKQLVLRQPREIPSYKEQKQRSDNYFRKIHSKIYPIEGTERPKFFSLPIITYPSEVIPFLHFPAFTLKKVPKVYGEIRDKAAVGKMNENTQTDFRDSEMQTSPWQPDFQLMNNDGSVSPQLLKLDFLKWGSGLPAGNHEVVLIERARMKRAWEKHLPPPTDDATLEKRRDIIDALERDEWAFREQEIHEIQELRMKLLEEMLNELHSKAKERNEMKLKNLAEIRKTETEAKIQRLRKKTERELRKLEMKQRGVNMKYHAIDVVEAHAHPKSELYAPLMRHGEHPMRWHQVMDEKLKYYKAQFIGVEEFSTLPRWINNATVLKDDYTTKLRGTHICIRETKWTTPVLKELHEELKNLHKTTKKRCTLRVRIDRSISEASTPETEELPDDEENKYQALIAVQSILKGRASQMSIYEGRDKCRKLIKELKYSTGLLEEQRESISETRKQIKQQQREEAIQRNRLAKLQKSLNKLEGSVVGSLLDFLNKELRRLLDERRAHAICFLNERERNDREAAEAGRRQQELRRRREHDEMFKQIVKVHQDTVDLYLQDIVTEGMEFASNDEATAYIQNLTQRIEHNMAAQLERSIDVSEQEETIADLVHHFVLPEVQKQMVRERIKKKQTQKMKLINDTLLDLVERIPSPKMDTELLETLWKDEENPTIVSGTVSSVSDETDADKFPVPSYSEDMGKTDHLPSEIMENSDGILEVSNVLEDIDEKKIIHSEVEIILDDIITKMQQDDAQMIKAILDDIVEEIITEGIEKIGEEDPFVLNE